MRPDPSQPPRRHGRFSPPRTGGTRLIPLALAALLAGGGLSGCGLVGGEGGGDDSGEGGSSSGGPAPGSCEIAEAPAGYVYPAGPYGSEEGDTFSLEGVQGLTDCDGNPFDFEDMLTSSELVLLNVSAGWCEPCIVESEEIEEHVFQRFCGRGLRIVQIIFEDKEGRPATSLTCQDWRDTYGLTFPVLRDPLFKTNAYFAGGSQTPLNLLINRDGQIIYRRTRNVPEDLADTLDAILPPAAE